MERSNSAPDLIEVSNTDFTNSHVSSGVTQDEGEKHPKKVSRKKQVSILTVTSGVSTELHNDDDDKFSEEEEADDGHGTGEGWGRGIIKDAKRTVGAHWIQEMTNFNQQTIAVSFFIFFAAISPAISKSHRSWLQTVRKNFH